MNFIADVAPTEIYENLLDDEMIFSQYQTYTEEFCKSEFIKIRKVIIDKIFEYGEKIKQRQLTNHIACAYFDILLFKSWNQHKVNQEEISVNENQRKSSLELKGITCLLLASKYDELDDRIPLIRELQKLIKFSFTYKECKDEESKLLVQLNWNLHVITPLHFVQNLLSMGVAFDDDRIQTNLDDTLSDHILKKIRKFSEYFADLSMKQQSLLIIRPSILAISCILCARLVNKVVPIWNSKFEEITNYEFVKDGIKTCFEKLYNIYDDSYNFEKNQQTLSISNTNTTCTTQTRKSVATNYTSKTPKQKEQTSKQTEIMRTKSVLEQNQNIMNDSKLNSSIIESEPTLVNDIPKIEPITNRISNVQQQIIGSSSTYINPFQQSQNNNSSSHRISVSQFNFQKIKPLHTLVSLTENTQNEMVRVSMVGANTSLQKRQSDQIKINKENAILSQDQTTLDKKQIQTISNENLRAIKLYETNLKQLVPNSCRTSVNAPTLEGTSKQLNLQHIQLIQSHDLKQLGSQSNKSNQMHPVINQQSLNQPQQTSQQLKHRNQSATNLHTQQSNLLITGGNKVFQKIAEIKGKSSLSHHSNKDTNSAHSRIQTLRSLNNSKTRKLSVNRSLQQTHAQLQSVQYQNVAGSGAGVNNYQLQVSNSANTSMICNKHQQQVAKYKQVFVSKSSRNSQNLVNSKKIEEIKSKYQSENTIYERNSSGINQNAITTKFLGFAQSKINPNSRSFNHKVNTTSNHLPNQSERSQSECSSLETQIFQQEKINQFQTIQEERKNTIVVEEEDTDCDKSLVEDSNISERTQQVNEDCQNEDESVIIKKPMSSKKSKSLENINKVNQLAKTMRINEQKALLEVYKQQQMQQQQNADILLSQRNNNVSLGTAEVGGRVTDRCKSKSSTQDLSQNLKNITNRINGQNSLQCSGRQIVQGSSNSQSLIRNMKGTNFIKKNIDSINSNLNGCTKDKFIGLVENSSQSQNKGVTDSISISQQIAELKLSTTEFTNYQQCNSKNPSLKRKANQGCTTQPVPIVQPTNLGQSKNNKISKQQKQSNYLQNNKSSPSIKNTFLQSNDQIKMANTMCNSIEETNEINNNPLNKIESIQAKDTECKIMKFVEPRLILINPLQFENNEKKFQLPLIQSTTSSSIQQQSNPNTKQKENSFKPLNKKSPRMTQFHQEKGDTLNLPLQISTNRQLMGQKQTNGLNSNSVVIDLFGISDSKGQIKSENTTARMCSTVKNNNDFNAMLHKLQSRRESIKGGSSNNDPQSQRGDERSHSKVMQINLIGGNQSSNMASQSTTKFQKFQSKKPQRKTSSIKNAYGGNSLLEQVLLKKSHLAIQIGNGNKTELDTLGNDICGRNRNQYRDSFLLKDQQQNGETTSTVQIPRNTNSVMNISKDNLKLSQGNMSKNLSQLNISTCCQDAYQQSQCSIRQPNIYQCMGVVNSARIANQKFETLQEIIKKDEENFKKIVNTFK